MAIPCKARNLSTSGFTLIELSIVLIIIGLLTAGILVGRDLIRAAEVRSQVSQYEKYNTATNAFRLKYNGLPGDFSAQEAANYGFIARSGARGHGDGNGIFETCDGSYIITWPVGCELVLFWSDLSKAGLISGDFPSASDALPVINNFADSFKYFPMSKIHNANTLNIDVDKDGHGWYVDVHITQFNGSPQLDLESSMAPASAYEIDSKIDDGNPIAGNVYVTLPFAVVVDVSFLQPGFFNDPAHQDPSFCVNNNAYNLANTGAIFCALAVKMQY